MPTFSDQNRLSSLTDSIRHEIKLHHGALSFSSFMRQALYHPTLGFYNAKSFTLGAKGDFTTAPEISPLFAACFAEQISAIFAGLSAKNILEFGAGTGQFACDLLTQLTEKNTCPTQYFIVEISAHLREKQRELLEKTHPHLIKNIVWLDTLPSDFEGVMIGNEVLDALPFKCFLVENGLHKERCVTFENNQFAWKTIDADFDLKSFNLPDGYQSEINLEVAPFMAKMAASLKKGVILLADYGYGEREYYHPERVHGTLTCFHQHHRNDNPFINIGEQDITAHVDFTRVAHAAIDHGLTLLGFTSQAAFLLALDFLKKAMQIEKGLNEAEKVNLHHAMKLLTLPSEMGDVIKIMALGKNFSLPLQGFALQDRRRDL